MAVGDAAGYTYWMEVRSRLVGAAQRRNPKQKAKISVDALSLANKGGGVLLHGAEKREGLYIGRGLFLPSLGGIVRQSRGRRDQGRESAERQDPSHSLCGSVRACAVACGLSLCHCLVSPRPVPPSVIPRWGTPATSWQGKLLTNIRPRHRTSVYFYRGFSNQTTRQFMKDSF